MPGADTSSWYKTQYGCLTSDPTRIARHHIFPDAPIPTQLRMMPVADSKFCLEYRTARPASAVDHSDAYETSRNHPALGFFIGAASTLQQIDAESQLRRLDQPLGSQAVLAEDSPLYRNTVAPPKAIGVSAQVQNASNPVATIVTGSAGCRDEADRVAVAMSNKMFNNTTRSDTQQFGLPFSPPGVGHRQ